MARMKKTPIHDASSYKSVGEWFRANLGRVPTMMAAALQRTMNEKGLTFPEAYALLVGEGAISEIPPEDGSKLASKKDGTKKTAKKRTITKTASGQKPKA
jgi:hypothetical protein